MFGKVALKKSSRLNQRNLINENEQIILKGLIFFTL